MSELAYFRFENTNLLNDEEKEHKEEVIQATNEILQVDGKDCDKIVNEMDTEQLIELHAKQRELRERKKQKKKVLVGGEVEEEKEEDIPLSG
jgi:hypothetical protein